MKKKEQKIPKEAILISAKMEANLDGRSGLHFKDYREGAYDMTRFQAMELMEKIEGVITNYINEKGVKEIE